MLRRNLATAVVLLALASTPAWAVIFLEVDSHDNLVDSNRVVASFEGINLGVGTDGNMITSNTLDGAGLGRDRIDLDGRSTGNTLKGNRVTDFGTGIELDLGRGNLILENVVRGNSFGINVHGGGNRARGNGGGDIAFDCP